ncbi:hypothetical protein THASP1DRAFT_26869, partial [Thamnocephalis sphaerospora]
MRTLLTLSPTVLLRSSIKLFAKGPVVYRGYHISSFELNRPEPNRPRTQTRVAPVYPEARTAQEAFGCIDYAVKEEPLQGYVRTSQASLWHRTRLRRQKNLRKITFVSIMSSSSSAICQKSSKRSARVQQWDAICQMAKQDCEDIRAEMRALEAEFAQLDLTTQREDCKNLTRKLRESDEKMREALNQYETIEARVYYYLSQDHPVTFGRMQHTISDEAQLRVSQLGGPAPVQRQKPVASDENPSRPAASSEPTTTGFQQPANTITPSAGVTNLRCSLADEAALAASVMTQSTIVPRKLPKFSGKSREVDAFFNAFERTLAVYGMDPQQHWARLLPLCMEMSTANWLCAFVPPTSTWAAVKELFKQEYGDPQHQARLRTETLSMKMRVGEPVIEFSRRLRAKACEAGFPDNDSDVVSTLIRGLPVFTQFMIRASRQCGQLPLEGITLSQLHRFLQALPEEPEMESTRASNTATPSASKSSSPKQASKYCTHHESSGHATEECRARKAELKRSQGSAPQGKPRCYTCNELGHYSTDCKTKQVLLADISEDTDSQSRYPPERDSNEHCCYTYVGKAKSASVEEYTVPII